MKLRNTFATVLAAAAGVMGMAVAPAMAAAPATTQAATTVTLKTPQLTTTFSSTNLSYGQTLKGTVHLGPTATNRTVTVYAENWSTGAVFVAATGKVNSAGNFTFTFWESQTRTWWAVFSGDASDNKVVTKGVGVHVNGKVSASLAGYYKTSTWAGHTLRTFHKTANIVFNGQALPDNGKASIDIQVHNSKNGQWIDSGSTPFNLGSDGKFSLNAGKDTSTGLVFRVIITDPGTKGNGAGYSNWLYLTSTN